MGVGYMRHGNDVEMVLEIHSHVSINEGRPLNYLS